MALASMQSEIVPELLIDPEQLKARINQSNDLTMLPAVAMEAIEMSNDPNCEIRDFVSVIEKDPHLVTDILFLSNSAMYQASTEIKGIRDAVVRVGFAQCQNLIFSSSMKSLSQKLPPAVEWSRDVLWRHSIHTATIARGLNRELKLGFEGEEFSGAMVHDVGRLLVAACAPDVFEVCDRLSFREDETILATEQTLMGIDHCELGAWFAESGQLPSALVDVIRFHHSPSAAPENQSLVQLVSAADHMANHLMNCGSAAGYVTENNPGLSELMASQPSNAARLSEEMMRAADEALQAMPTS